MSLKYLALLALIFVMAMFISPVPVDAECACMQHKDPSLLLAEEQARARALKSENQRQIARGFREHNLQIDAQNAYKDAVALATAELAQIRQQKDTGMVSAVRYETLVAHTTDIQRETTDYYRAIGKYADAAAQLEATLANQSETHPQTFNIVDQYKLLASLYEAAGNHRQAAACYEKLILWTQGSKGRYSPEVTNLQAKLHSLNSQ